MRIAGLVYSVVRTCLINIRKSHFSHAILLICPLQEEKQTHDFQYVKLAQESKHMVVLARHLKFVGRI